MFENKVILVTGGTGSFGQTFVPMTLAKYNPKKIIIFSRDEMKQWDMAKNYQDDPRVRFFIGDVRDRERLYRALDGVDYVVHAAATKIGNAYSGEHGSTFSVVRYGNVMGSRGSVIPFFMSIKDTGELPITDPRMTRFMISLEEGVELVWHAFEDMMGGEIYVKKIPSMRVPEIATVVAPEATQKTIGIRPGEKLHEQMIGVEDAPFTFEYPEHYKILPQINNWFESPERIKDGKTVAEDFVYSSETNDDWMSEDDLAKWIADNQAKIGKI